MFNLEIAPVALYCIVAYVIVYGITSALQNFYVRLAALASGRGFTQSTLGSIGDWFWLLCVVFLWKYQGGI